MDFGQGTYAILSTPFAENGEIDVDSLRKEVEYYCCGGVLGVVALAVMGEGAKILPEERDVVIETVVKAAIGHKVVVGVSAPATLMVQKRTLRARELGADAVLLAPPVALSLADYIQYYAAAGGEGLPVILQDHPESTGVQLSTETIVEIVKQVPAVRAIKLEAPPTGHKTAQLRRQLSAGECRIYGGLGALYLMEELAAGSDGTMTGYAFPTALRDIVSLYHKGDERGAEATYRNILHLLLHESTPKLSLAIRKEFLRLHGVIRHAFVRHPGPTLDNAVLERTRRLYETVKANH